jgi:hypothetical protein
MSIYRFGREIQDMLHHVHCLPQRRERDKTFLEIAGYPHLENVASNILGFYFQSSNIHNYGNILFRAVLSFFDSDASTDIAVNVRREDVTAENKRIDLVIETEDTIIGIENKIYHELNNDLKIYWSHLKAIAGEKRVLGIVLSLRAVNLPFDEAHFINITYDQFLEEIDLLLYKIHNEVTDRYSLFFQDFQETMRNLSRGTTMDYERLEFFKYHRQEIHSLLQEIKQIREEMRAKLKMLAEAHGIEDRFSPLPTSHQIRQLEFG